jgi:hypothetical protein
MFAAIFIALALRPEGGLAEQIEGLLEGCLLASGLAQMFLQLVPDLRIVLAALDLPFEQLDCLTLHGVRVAEPGYEVVPWLRCHRDLLCWR